MTNFRSLLRIALLALAASGVWGAQAGAADAPEVVPSRILALYDGSAGQPRGTRIHRYAELPLNHLGYRLDYFDIAAGLPPPELSAEMAAIVVWFDDTRPAPDGFATWAATVTRLGSDPAGLKMIVLGEPGVEAPDGGSEPDHAYLDRIGLGSLAPDQRPGLWSWIEHLDSAMIGLERDFTILHQRMPVTGAREGAESHLRLATGPEGGTLIDLVVTSGTGAFAEEAALLRDDGLDISRWILDPFAFFEQVLAPGLRPVPDPTTLDGRRVFFSTINGTGWTATAPSDRFEETAPRAGAMALDWFITPYPDLPVSLALISGDFDPALNQAAGEEDASVVARAAGEPQVTIASMTRTMPLRWAFFENYDRESELVAVEALAQAPQVKQRGLLTAAVSNLGRAFVPMATAFHVASAAPRRYVGEPFVLEAEIEGSLRELGDLAQAPDAAGLIVWSGDGAPFEGALRAAREAGAEALGGGGGIMDPTRPSLTGLMPISVPVGDERQIYAGLSDDAAFTNNWTTPAHGFFRLEETLKATETPRRLKPYHLSYSIYSVLQVGSRNAVLHHLERARTAELRPVTAETYARMANGFSAARMVALGGRSWRIEDRGALQTVRFDAGGAFALDMARSEGVLGARSKGPALYVALDPTHSRPVVTLAPPGDLEAASWFSLGNSRWEIRDLIQDSCSARFVASGFGPGDMVWHVPHPGTYRLEVLIGETPAYWKNVEAGEDRRASISMPAIGSDPVRVVLSRC